MIITSNFGYSSLNAFSKDSPQTGGAQGVGGVLKFVQVPTNVLVNALFDVLMDVLAGVLPFDVVTDVRFVLLDGAVDFLFNRTAKVDGFVVSVDTHRRAIKSEQHLHTCVHSINVFPMHVEARDEREKRGTNKGGVTPSEIRTVVGLASRLEGSAPPPMRIETEVGPAILAQLAQSGNISRVGVNVAHKDRWQRWLCTQLVFSNDDKTVGSAGDGGVRVSVRPAV